MTKGSSVRDARDFGSSFLCEALRARRDGGLIGGLVVGVVFVAAQAVLSDRIRRRDEVASLLGAPVELSLKPGARSRSWHRETLDRAVSLQSRRESWVRSPATSADAGYAREAGKSLLVVAMDDLTVPAAALAMLGKRLADEGESCWWRISPSEGLLARTVENLWIDRPSLQIGRAAAYRYSRRRRRHERARRTPVGATADGANTVLVLTRVDPARGAWHLRWAKQAVVSVTAGRSSAQRVSSTAGPASSGGDHDSIRGPDRRRRPRRVDRSSPAGIPIGGLAGG